MAKKMNLLLTAALAVICLTALICVTLLPMTTACAADYEYVLNADRLAATVSDTPSLFVAKISGSNYALYANGTKVGLKSVTIADNKITTAVDDTMLWTCEGTGYNNNYRKIKNVSTNTYIIRQSWGTLEFSATGSQFRNEGFNDESYLQTDDYYLYAASAFNLTTNTSSKTAFAVYEQTAMQVSDTEKTITFNKGSDTATGTMADAKWDTANGDYTLPACTFTNQYYLFSGWKVGDSEEVKAAGDTITLDDNVTLTAVWEYNAWDITFKMDGKTDVVKHAEKGKAYTMPNFTGIFSSGDVPADKLFVKWQDADGNFYNNGTNYTLDKDIELTPVFGKKVTISFDFNGGSANSSNPTSFPETKTHEYAAGSVQRITTYYNPEKTNYTLTGWKCGDLVVKSGVEFTVADEDMCFVAQWKFDGIVLTFDDGTNSTDIELASGTTSYTIAVNDPAAPAGQKFLGWQIEGDESGTLYSKNIAGTSKSLAISGDEMTLNAVYRDLKTYNVTLHYGATSKTVQYVEDTKNIQFNSATFTDNEMGTIDNDHMFMGWYKEDTLKTQMSTSYLTADDSFENLHLYAKVEAYFWVHFDYGFKTNESDESNIIVDRRAVEGSQGVAVLYSGSGADYHAKEKYTLKGWAATEGGDVVYVANDRTYITSACTVYAVWDYDYYVITLTVNGDEPVTLTAEVAKSATKYTLGEVIASLSAADQAKLNVEHKTLNWVCVDDDYRPTKLNDELTYKKNIAFAGTFTDIIYKITVTNLGGDNVVIEGKYGDPVTAPDTTRAGYEFKGFKLNGQDYTFTTMPGENIEVYCQYEALDSTITFDTGDGGTAMEAITAKTGSMIDKPADPAREGYAFVKWQIDGKDVAWLVKDGTSTNPEYYINMPGGDVTMVAKWELTAEGLAALKSAKLTALDAYVTEKGVDLAESYTNAINNATTQDAVIEAYNAAIAKVDELKALADAKTAAKAEVAAKATEAGVTAPSTDEIDNATTIDAVNAAKTAALAKITEAAASKAKVAAVQAQINALSGKKGAELFTAITEATAAKDTLTADEKAQLDMTAYTAAKTAYNAYMAAVSDDLNVASDIAMSVAAVKLASAVTAIAALLFVLKRRAL